MARQSGKRLIHQLQQARTVTFKMKSRAQQLQVAMMRPRCLLAEWIGALVD